MNVTTMTKKGAFGATLCVALVTLMACSGDERTTPTAVGAVAPEATTAPAPEPSVVQTPVDALASPLASPLESPLGDAMQIGTAGVDKVTLRVEPGNAGRVIAKVSGYLGDACTSLGAVTQVRDGALIRVSVGTLRPRDRMCAQVIKDFEIDVAIDVTGLAVGAYAVDVNGAPASFEIDAGGPIVR